MSRNATFARIRLAPQPAAAQTAHADALNNRYTAVRQATMTLIAGLSAEDCALQSMPDASPLKWHLAHTSWFFETFVLEQNVPGYQHFHPQFRMLFNSYYVGVGERHPRAERGLLSRPSLEDIVRYRRHVDASMQQLMNDVTSMPPSLCELIELGLNHEQQHQELMLTDLKHLLSRNPLKPAYRVTPFVPTNMPAAALQWIAFSGGLQALGHDGDEFSFDNELPRHRVFLENYVLASRLVTNSEYLAFMDDGGYARPDLWLSEGWDMSQVQRWQAPLYWEKRDGQWQMFTLSGMEKVDPAAPVCHVSYFEADAYARWADARLPSEAEWEVAAMQADAESNFMEDGTLCPLPASATGRLVLQQLFGDVWEWTHSSYAPYPGYRTAPGAVGEYNGKFMVNQYVLRGGSFATPRSHIRATYRNFFPATARWQFSGIRLARDTACA